MQKIIQFITALALLAPSHVLATDFADAVSALKLFRSSEADLRISLEPKEFVLRQGRAEPLSDSELAKLEHPMLTVGSEGPEVVRVQQALIEGSWLEGAPDGLFGARTAAAVKKFQASSKLAADGLVGNQTWEALGLGKERNPAWRATSLINFDIVGRTVTYQLSPTFQISELRGKDEKISWSKTVYREVARYPRNEWAAFIGALVPEGLMSLRSIELKDSAWIMLKVRSALNTARPLGKNSILVSSTTYESLKVPARFPSRLSKSGRGVVFVHEPHWSVSGQLQLLDGLDGLIRGNEKRDFKFLVEGDLPEMGRNIPATNLANILSSDMNTRRQQVHYLLKNFLIDGSMAYRILYDSSIPAIAIDDPEALSRSLRRADVATGSEVREAILPALRGLDEDLPDHKVVLQTAALLFGLNNVKVESDGKLFVELLKAKSEASRSLADMFQNLSPKKYAPEISFLRKHAKNLEIEKGTFSVALERDKTMVSFINKHFKGADAKKVPVVFIGSFHTSGIIELLPRDMGYVVLEPRVVSNGSDEEQEAFRDALHDYSKVLTKLERSLRKLKVSPTEEEIRRIKTLLPKVKIKPTVSALLVGARLDHESAKAIVHSVERNGALSDAKLSLAGGGSGKPPAPPPGFEASFASFEMGRDGSRPSLMLLPGKSRQWDKESQKEWRSEGRLLFLERVVLASALELSGGRSSRSVSFLQDSKSGTIFSTVYDSKTRTYHFFEGEGALDAVALIAIPVTDKEKSVHMQIVRALRELLRRLT